MRLRQVLTSVLRRTAVLLVLVAIGLMDSVAQEWIGAITKADARIPEGRSFSGGRLKGEAKQLWETVDSLSRRSIVVCKDFVLRGRIEKAEARVCGLGFYEFSVNDSRVGDALFSPLWSDYDKTVFYNTYDLTDLLRPDRNRIKVLLGNGFYNEQGGRYAKMRISFGPPTLFFDMTVWYADGTSERIVSDASWRYCQSPVVYNSIYGGEDYDARLEIADRETEEWMAMSHPVVVQEAPRGVLRPQMAKPVKIMEYYDVSERMSIPRAQRELTVVDMGQNLSGFPEITVSGRAGQTVRLTVGEKLSEEGRVDQRQTGRPHFYTYTLKGTGRETWHPRFSYYGYRFVEIEGGVMEGDDNPDELPVVHSIRSCFVYNSARKTGDFECSNPLFNDVYRIIDRAVRSNWQAVWTDCPHREKLGWLEQDWLNGEGLVYNYDCRQMIEQTMQNIADAQHADGSMPEIAPEYTVFEGSWAKPFLESPEWGGAIIALPLLYQKHYGDDRLIADYYDKMMSYVEYLHTQDSCYILKQGLGDWYDYGEGRAGFSKNTPMPLVSTAHYYQWTSLMQAVAQRLGRNADYKRLKERAWKIRRAYQKEFFIPQSRQYGSGSQCANAISLVMGLVREKDRKAVLSNLVADIHAHGDRLTTGDVGNRYLFQALTENGMGDLLYTMLNHDSVPGYGYQIKKGMTTLSEQWDPEQGASLNHFMMAHINNLLIPSWVGIRVSGDNLVIAPGPVGDLTWCKGRTEVLDGVVSVSWKRCEEKFSVDVYTPQTTTVVLPFSGKRMRVEKGNYHFEENIN